MDLSTEQAEIVQRFKEIVNITDDARAAQILRRKEWNLEDAVTEYVEQRSDDSGLNSIRRRRASEDTRDHPNHHSGRGNAQEAGRNRSSQQVSGTSTSLHSWLLGMIGSLLLSPLRYLTGFNGNLDPVSAVDYFLKEFQKKFLSENARRASGTEINDRDETMASFSRCSYREALSRAAREEKLLLVYLHSMQHPDSGPFINQVLCSADVSRVVNDRMVSWGGCVEFAEAYHLSNILNVASYPYVAILEPPADSRQSNAKLLERVEGKVAAGVLLQKITKATEEHGGIVAQRVAQRYEANERQRLREEQDEALRRSVEEDRRREEERKRKQEEEERAKREEEENARRKEEEERLFEENRMASYEEKKARLKPEPAMDAGKVAKIRFQMPSGAKVQRRFLYSATLQEVRDFIDCKMYEDDMTIHNYAIVLNFPKKEFRKDDDLTTTVEENGLCPQAVLFVQDLDS